jgi:TonB family protein
VEALIATGELPSLNGRFVKFEDAVDWGRRLRPAPLPDAAQARLETPAAAAGVTTVTEPPTLFESHAAAPRQPALPAAVSAAAHGLAVTVAVVLTSIGIDSASASRVEYRVSEPMRLVFLPIPGPGGGGGGGGLRQQAPPPAARRQGTRPFSSPMPERQPPPAMQAPKPEAPPPPLTAEALPQVIAPVATSPSDDADRPGVLEKTEAAEGSRGPGDGGGVGSGSGTGIGEGDGSGIGPGSGGGMGGGPYRPGSGIQPPSLLREVKPDYTEDARRRGITGDVLLEIVVRANGQVGEVRVLDGLGHGLDERAVAAVRQWRFSPARRFGQPVDVLVEVAVEFRLR